MNDISSDLYNSADNLFKTITITCDAVSVSKLLILAIAEFDFSHG